MHLRILLSILGRPKGAFPDDWKDFLDDFVVTFCIVLVVTVLVIVVFYTIAARRRKIRFPADTFSSYGPMWWLLLSLGGALAAALLFNHYVTQPGYISPDALPVMGSDTFNSRVRYAFLLGGYTALLCAAISWAFTLIPGITPLKFIYRPAPFFHGRGGHTRMAQGD